MIYLKLVLEFFKIGLFSFGGGYATIPFLYNISEVYDWYSIKELSQMIAVASVTPGPVGINVATYAGLKTAGVWGSLCATISEMLPSLFIVILVSKILKNFSENIYVKALLETLKPVGCGLLAYIAFGMFKPHVYDARALLILAVLLLISWKSKKEPIVYMIISAVAGITVFEFFS